MQGGAGLKLLRDKQRDHLPEIQFKTINHKDHRYPTVGDYYEKRGVHCFRVSRMCSTYEFLVLIHELIEWFLTRRRGITEQSITDFDIRFEREREDRIQEIKNRGPRRGRYGRTRTQEAEIEEANSKEPGDDPRAPYKREHQFATSIERLVAKECGVTWDQYDKTVMSL